MKIQIPTREDERKPGYNAIINLRGSTPLVLCMAAFRDPDNDDPVNDPDPEAILSYYTKPGLKL